MSAVGKSLQALVQDFFEQHLVIERNVSPNTVLAYRDALKLFLRHASDRLRRSPDKIDHTVLTPDFVREFLSWLKSERRCGPRTRNHRLAALKSFTRYVAQVAPEHLERCRQIREMPMARFEHPEISYLDDAEVVGLIKAVNTTASKRDTALLLLLYNTGARVQEIADLRVEDIQEQPIPFVRLRGKGRKHRTCPLWSRTVAAIREWLVQRGSPGPSEPLFLNAQGRVLSRSGITHILRAAVLAAGLVPKHAGRISPHVVRHTTAMHLLQSGVDITTIAAWLGHSQLSTTHGYVEIDLRMKQAAVASTTGLPEMRRGRYPSPDLVTWLERIGRRHGYAQPESSHAPPH
jgi:site-specific recombinase XerD